MMDRIVYIDGNYVNENDAKVSIFDRGFLFGDAVYEVTAVLGGKLVDNGGHLERLQRSCNELQLPLPATAEEITTIQRTLIDRNQLKEGGVYLQLSRGSSGDRDFAYPQGVKPTLVLFTQSRPLLEHPKAVSGIKVVTLPDIRWQRRDIKSVGLLAPCMAKQYALDNGADDAWWVEHGEITEGSSSNAYIVTADDTVITRPLGNDILHGITRKMLLQKAAQAGIRVEERPFSVQEAYEAREAFISSATTFVWPVVSIDTHPIGDGKPGPVATRLRQIYIDIAKSTAE